MDLILTLKFAENSNKLNKTLSIRITNSIIYIRNISYILWYIFGYCEIESKKIIFTIILIYICKF